MTCFYDGTLNGPQGLLLALLVGLPFGFWLERAGFGSSRKLAAIFYLRDFAVLKVMFSAIVTAAVGMWALTLAGLVDLEQVYRPVTILGPQILGGLLFGVGFVMGGWCPGTALVGAASGKGDALAFLVAAGVGSLAYGALFPLFAGFTQVGDWGVSTLPELLGFSPGAVTLAVLVVALLAFVGATRVEQIMAARAPARAEAQEVTS